MDDNKGWYYSQEIGISIANPRAVIRVPIEQLRIMFPNKTDKEISLILDALVKEEEENER